MKMTFYEKEGGLGRRVGRCLWLLGRLGNMNSLELNIGNGGERKGLMVPLRAYVQVVETHPPQLCKSEANRPVPARSLVKYPHRRVPQRCYCNPPPLAAAKRYPRAVAHGGG